MNNKTKGRPKGSNSFTQVSLSDLNSFFREKASITVSRKWLEAVGFEIEEDVAMSIEGNDEPMLITSTTNIDPEPKIEFTVSE